MKLFGLDHFKSKAKKEADAASSFPQLTRARKTERALSIKSSLKLTESEANPVAVANDPTRFRVTLIKEGLGNFGTCYFYTKQCLQLAAAEGIFDGKKANSDHPSKTEEVDRPERSVKDAFGHYENIAYSEINGQGMLQADLVIIDDPAFDRERAYLQHCVEYSQKYPNQDFMGLSINASGDAVETEISQFILENPLCEAVKAKLAEAQAMGIAIIRPVARLTAAESVDLVTEAGAGGRVDQILEQENKMKKFSKFLESKDAEAKEKKESEEKAAKEKEAKEKKEAGNPDQEAAPAPADKNADPDGDGVADAQDPADQDDADQDKELIRAMLMKYLGDGHDDQTYEMAQEAIKAAKESGMDEDEAMKCAGYAMKMAKLMSKKPGEDAPAPAAAGAEPSAPAAKKPPVAKPAAAPAPAEADAGQKDPSQLAPESKKESAKVLTLTAEIAKLKETIKKYELMGCEGALDKALRESKLPMAATKKFRECLGTLKSEAELNEKLKIFQEAYGVSGEADPLIGFVPERTTNIRESDGGLNLSDCVKKQD